MNTAFCPKCECSIEFSRRIPDILVRDGFQISQRKPLPVPSFHYVVSDGLRRAALVGMKHKERMVLLLAPLRSGFRLRGWFGREKFGNAVIECLRRAIANDPGNGFAGAGVTALLKPPPSFLSASEAKELPADDA